MSIAVALDELRAEITKRGDAAFIITSGGASPHVVSARIAWDGDALTAGAGNTTARNIGVQPIVSLLWPASFDDYSLIVDGSAAAHDGVLRIEPTRAVLHRSAAAGGDGPTCVTLV
jgi:hypothetical protein